MAKSRAPDMESRLRSSGRRLTPERELLLRIIEQNAHLDAEEIYRLAQQERPQIGLATVYRTLTLLKEMGIIRATNLGENHFHYEVLHGEHVHLVCSNCGHIKDIPIPIALLKAAKNEKFVVSRTRFEMFGLCASCAEALPSEEIRG